MKSHPKDTQIEAKSKNLFINLVKVFYLLQKQLSKLIPIQEPIVLTLQSKR